MASYFDDMSGYFDKAWDSTKEAFSDASEYVFGKDGISAEELEKNPDKYKNMTEGEKNALLRGKSGILPNITPEIASSSAGSGSSIMGAGSTSGFGSQGPTDFLQQQLNVGFSQVDPLKFINAFKRGW